MSNGSFNILSILSENLKIFLEERAFYINGTAYTYQQFHIRISAIQKFILSNVPENEKYLGILGNDHLDTYASIFAIWFSGKTFVPLNPQNPSERNREILRQMNIKLILSAGEPLGLDAYSIEMTVNSNDLKDSEPELTTVYASPETDAYVLFTSGSTGQPKGVRISRGNLDAFYHSYISFFHDYRKDDRFLQMYDISFDGSIPCYLIPLCTGASVYTVPQDEIKYLYALKLMRDHELTILKMTPSILFYLRPFFDRINLPHIRQCLFGGEALPVDIVVEWMKCIPGAAIINVYGPTEASIDCLAYCYNSGDFPKRDRGGVISLGKSFGDFEYAVLHSDGTHVEEGGQGELCLYGPQVMKEYWKDEKKSFQVFVHLETEAGIKKFYRTGDLVSRDENGFFYFHGRLDDQVQVQGYRVELGEIEKHALEAVGGQSLAAVLSKNAIGNAEITLFIMGDEMDQEPILAGLQSKLPHYMLPSRIVFLKEFPLLASGKTDRKKLSQIAETYEKP
jgi:D-alanine--poly(phosphoribitol) ligase subunit 1